MTRRPTENYFLKTLINVPTRIRFIKNSDARKIHEDNYEALKIGWR